MRSFRSVEFNSGYIWSIVKILVSFSYVLDNKAGEGMGDLGVLPTIIVCCILLIPDSHKSKYKNLLSVCRTLFPIRFINFPFNFAFP